jgi:RNA polymerase sigma-70 factor (ECF subfamily)
MESGDFGPLKGKRPGEIAELGDEELAARCRGGVDERAFEELWRRHEGRLRARCYRVLQDPGLAEDAAQETFLVAARRLEQYEPGNFGGWLWRIAYHLCIDRLRSMARRKEVELQLGETEADVNRDGWEEKILAEELVALLGTLSENQRVVMKLFYLEEMSYADIERTTGMSAKEVKTHIQNGRRMLRRRWEEKKDGR